jgi:hypothetical protein
LRPVTKGYRAAGTITTVSNLDSVHFNESLTSPGGSGVCEHTIGRRRVKIRDELFIEITSFHVGCGLFDNFFIFRIVPLPVSRVADRLRPYVEYILDMGSWPLRENSI